MVQPILMYIYLYNNINLPANTSDGYYSHVHGNALLVLSPNRQDAIELTYDFSLCVIIDGRNVRNKNLCQRLVYDLVLLKGQQLANDV